jgi:hypothetical protein
MDGSSMLDRRILIVARYFDENLVGTQRLRHLAAYLKKNGMTVSKVNTTKGWSKERFIREVVLNIWRFQGKIVFVSCGPFYYLAAATLISVVRKKTLIVDFRDPLSFNFSIPDKDISVRNAKRAIHLFWARARERFAYYFSSTFIVCSTGMYELYSRLFGNTKKLRMIPNGFDFTPPASTLALWQGKEQDIERFICIGKFLEYSETKARSIFEKLLERKMKLGKKVLIIFYNDETTKLKSFVEGLGLPLGFSAEYRGRIPYEMVIKEAFSFDCGIVVIRNESFDVGTKIYDFIGLGLPVLDVFDHNANFYKSFHNFCLDRLAPMFQYQPDIRYHRSTIWAANLDIFGLQPIELKSPFVLTVESGVGL